MTIGETELIENYIGDNREELDTDWIGNGESNSVLSEINKMTKIDWMTGQYPIVHKQNDRASTKTSCTKFSALNAVSNMYHETITHKEIDEVEVLSLSLGRRGTGYGWSRGLGVSTVRKWRNARHPNKELTTWHIDIIDNKNNFTREFNAYMDKGGIACVSIDVYYSYVVDIKDGVLDLGGPHDMGRKHATTITKVGDDRYMILDSSFPIKGPNPRMTGKVLKDMINHRNMKPNCHIFIPLIHVPMIAQDVPASHQHAEAIKRLIESSITTEGGENKKYRPGDPITRGEMATMLKRLNDFILKWKQ